MDGSAIEAEGLVKTYPKGVRALDGVGFAVEAGTVFGLLGPNGAGKSTTVKILTALTLPDEGRARVAGHDVVRQPLRVRKAIGVVGQKPRIDPDATGRENLRLQGDLYGMPPRAARARADDGGSSASTLHCSRRCCSCAGGSRRVRSASTSGRCERPGYAPACGAELG
jgi:ABC-2 type transport system ATP-binding protein